MGRRAMRHGKQSRLTLSGKICSKSKGYSNCSGSPVKESGSKPHIDSASQESWTWKMSSQYIWIWRTVELAYGESGVLCREQTLPQRMNARSYPLQVPLQSQWFERSLGQIRLLTREPPKRQQLGLTEGHKCWQQPFWEPIYSQDIVLPGDIMVSFL